MTLVLLALLVPLDPPAPLVTLVLLDPKVLVVLLVPLVLLVSLVLLVVLVPLVPLEMLDPLALPVPLAKKGAKVPVVRLVPLDVLVKLVPQVPLALLVRKDLLVLTDLLALLVPLDLRVLLDSVVWSVFPVREEKEASLVFPDPLVNPANKVLLEQVVNVVPLALWAPLDWLAPLVNLGVRDPLVLRAPLEEMVLPVPRVTVVRLAPLAPLVPLVLLVLPALLARAATAARAAGTEQTTTKAHRQRGRAGPPGERPPGSGREAGLAAGSRRAAKRHGAAQGVSGHPACVCR